ncbi:HepT-like ribonuclease domain-containing protein [Elioraea tepidiphila]|uniref:HepT-like ribonuclease domain-containing protein n=1 Tax=Elioraea tepidiphila TaxID=457934 RepID=UPI00316AC8BA
MPWREITGMRHRLIHGHAEVRIDLVWSVVRDRLPALDAVLAPLVDERSADRSRPDAAGDDVT